MDQDLNPLIHRFGAVETQFLAQAVEVLDPPPPITLLQTVSVREAVQCLQKNKIGCVLAVDDDGRLTGVFSERDVVSRVILKDIDIDKLSLADVMTKNPRTEKITTTVAFILQQMSDGGFRHLPLMDEDDYPIGIVSVKDVLDFIKLELISQLIKSEFRGN